MSRSALECRVSCRAVTWAGPEGSESGVQDIGLTLGAMGVWVVIRTFKGDEASQRNGVEHQNRKAHTELELGRISKTLDQGSTPL